MSLHKKKMDKKLEFSKQNSRIDFGSLIFEASKQKDAEGLELILAQNGANEHINYVARDGMTPLTMAAKNGDMRCVKALLAHKCELHVKGRLGGQEKFAWEIAKEQGFVKVAQYLNGCVDDLVKYSYHRAMMEADVLEICKSKRLKQNDLREFDKHMERLMKMDTFSVDGDGYTDSLLVVAARADNRIIVERLMEKYDATPYANDQLGETALHKACRKKSDLRFYLTKKNPELLFAVDIEGVQPLHIACENNDMNYFTWIFQSVLEDLEKNEGNKRNANPFLSLQSTSHIHAPLLSRFTQPELGEAFSPDSDSSGFLSKSKEAYQEEKLSPCSDGTKVSTHGDKGRHQFFTRLNGHTCDPECFQDPEQPIHFPIFPLHHDLSEDSPDSSNSQSFILSSPSNCATHINRFTFSDDGSDGSSAHTFSRPGSESSRYIEDSFLYSTSSMVESMSTMLKETCSSHGDSPLSIKDLMSLHMRLFAVNSSGHSVLHIASKNGDWELLHLILQVAKVLEHNPDGADVNILTRRDAGATPIEQAISSCQPICLRLLLEFASETPIINEILNDETLLSQAVVSGELKILEVLLEFGMWKGLSQAIQASMSGSNQRMLQIVMFYYTQIMSLLRSTRVKHNREVCMDKALVSWEELELEEVRPLWLKDATTAVTSVAHLLRVGQYHHPIQENHELFAKIGKDCVEYFKVHIWQTMAHPKAWKVFHITDMNLSSNHLQSIPPELFQIQSLKVLDLSHNRLYGLPSSLDFQNPLYTCHSLSKLCVNSNRLQTLPEDLFFAFGNSLEELHANDNQIEALPPGLWICPRLHTVILGQNKLKQLHYFSDKKYFYDQDFSRLLIDGIYVDRNVPMNLGKANDEEFMEMMNYVTRLSIFNQTVKALLPEVLEEEEPKDQSSLLQHVIDIHWLRSKLYSDKTATLDYFDVSLPPDETCRLKSLDLSQNLFTEFPWDLACIAPNLEKLDFRGNQVKTLNLIKNLPSSIESIVMSDNKITSISADHSVAKPCGSPVKLLSGYLTDPNLTGNCRHTQHCILDKATNLNLNNNSLTAFSCIRKTTDGTKPLKKSSSIDVNPYPSLYPNLSVLSLDQNNLDAVPEGIHFLSQLSSLSLSHNSMISKLPPEMGLMNPQTLLIVKLEGVYPKNINQRLLERPGARGILTYLKSLHQKSLAYHRIKLMVIGNSNVGKTSLLLNLTHKGRVTRFKEVEKGVNKLPLSTVGVDLGDWEYPLSKKQKVTFMTWDFGGQEEYYATHQCFLTQRSLYVLVWNVQMKEAGLESIKPWLENIGGRVPGAPVVVVGTHCDSIPQQRLAETLKHLNSQFQKMFLNSEIDKRAYPNIHPKCFFVSSKDGTNINSLREELHEFALSIKPSGRRTIDIEPLLKQHVPECYIKLQDIIRDVASRYAKENKHPVLSRAEIRQIASNGNFPGNLDELEQGIQFLHENGILLHYDDPALSDVYFIDPQWLCSMLACVVTIPERNPFHKDGFMELSALYLLLKEDQFPHALIKEFVSLMQKFEVVHPLDESRLLIPSLLPSDEGNAYVVFPTSVPTVTTEEKVKAQEISQQGFSRLNSPVFARYYVIPFIPNGFFPRLLARILGSGVGECFTECVSQSDSNNLHWRCWRNGIILVNNQLEVLRVSPVHFPLANTDETVIISSTESHHIKDKGHSMIQIMVSVLPETLISGKSPLLPSDKTRSVSYHLAIWALRKLVEIIDSVFDDWYDAFARRKGFDLRTVEQASPCPKCLQQTALNNKSSRRDSFLSTLTSQLSSYMGSMRTLHLFTSPFCVLAASKNEYLPCPIHGPVPVLDVAPDLAFADFSSDKLFFEPQATVKKLQPLGSGGFGSVHSGILDFEDQQKRIAVKEFITIACKMKDDGEEYMAWDVYLNGSKEARMMNFLSHTHILELIGLAFRPLRLLLELAPMGDLKDSIKPFKRAHVKLNRQILKTLIFQVADAMEYIHSKKIIYRDLKPGNILVWEFPEPKTQWGEDASVFIKLADYGISKHCTPEGVRGTEGTPAYLPPEVIVHGGTASFTTKLDVYSFGMLLYYLFTFHGPFEIEKGRPVSALLDEQKRPELALGDRPPALQMYELMCWCWSERPQDRPTFTQIKQLLESSAFTRLFGATNPVTRDDSFTAACVHTHKQQPITTTTVSTTQQQTSDDDKLSRPSPSPSVVSLLAASVMEDTTTKVWYGTEKGRLGYVQFTSQESNYKIVEQFKCPVLTLCVCGVQVWVGTKGEGVSVYSVLNPKGNRIAMWNEKNVICKLMYIKQSTFVFGLTMKGLAIFETSFGGESEGVRSIQPIMFYAADPIMTVGMVVPPRGRQEDAEVWCCSEKGRVKIFNGCDKKMHGIQHLQFPEAQRYEMICFEKDEQNKAAIAFGSTLQIWSTYLKQPEGLSFHCHEACYGVYGSHVEKSAITSLLVVRDTVYIGTDGGLIVTFNHRTQEASQLLSAYNSSVRCLVPINRGNYIKRFSRIYSRRDLISPKSLSTSVMASTEGTLSNSGERASSERNLVLSFGKGYRGITGNSKNCPQSLMLPSDKSFSCSFCMSTSRASCICQEKTLGSQPTKPDPETGYMLYWLDDEPYVVSDTADPHRLSITSVNTIPEGSETLSSTTS